MVHGRFLVIPPSTFEISGINGKTRGVFNKHLEPYLQAD
jgi:hypothetical protein